MRKKRFQECNWLGKMWRCRFYILIPFKYVWFRYVVPFKIGKDEIVNGELTHTNEYYVERGKNLWRLLVGETHISMGWYFTSDEVMGLISGGFKKK
jgi:hypothetical protein